jgi:hypothetical protein
MIGKDATDEVNAWVLNIWLRFPGVL